MNVHHALNELMAHGHSLAQATRANRTERIQHKEKEEFMAVARKTPSTSKRPFPQLSAITPGDFGLKAGFMDQGKSGKISFRSIVGWVSVTNYRESERLPFCGVVVADDDTLSLAAKPQYPDFVGYFKNDLSVDDARKLIEREGVRVGGVRGSGRPVE
jgi:hypothetical protein